MSNTDASTSHLHGRLNKRLSLACVIAGMLSILASIGIWFFFKTDEAAHAERFGIFVGLWAPTFIGLACWLGLQRGRGS
jgi:hypothetical protein